MRLLWTSYAAALFAAGTAPAWADSEPAADTEVAAAASATLMEAVVVTGRRAPSRQSETPQKLEVISAEDLERTVAQDLTDTLKKNSSVDVIQYPGMLSGIGMRGFRPEFSGINKHSLLLVDGRPAGSTNLSTIMLDNVERIEVQKGPASALYGPSAMGGVVNIITRRPSGGLKGHLGAGHGSFDSHELAAGAGGDLGSAAWFGLSARHYDQNDDYRVGGGDTKPHTRFETTHATGRLGTQLSPAWTLEGSGEFHQDRDVGLPADDEAPAGSSSSTVGTKDLDRTSGELRLSGTLGPHAPTLVAYVARERGNNIRVTSTRAAEQPFLPFLSAESDLQYRGLQARNDWTWGGQHHLLLGADFDQVDSDTRSYNADGTRKRPFSADHRRRTQGVFAQNSLRFNEGRSIVEAGVRQDHITVETFAFASDVDPARQFTPSRASFDRFSPSVGFKQALWPGLRLHGTVGRGFVVPEARELTGFSQTTVGGRPQTTRGNPDLDPESSRTWDVGLEQTGAQWRLDLTYFETRVKDRITRSTVTHPQPPAGEPDPGVEITFVNADDANIRGLELEARWQALRPLGLFFNANHYLQFEESVGPLTRDIYNVAEWTLRGGIDVELGDFGARLSARYVGERKDNNFNVVGNPEVSYRDFVVTDLSLRLAVAAQHRVSLDAGNIFDESYFEKLGYTMPGRSLFLRYGYEF